MNPDERVKILIVEDEPILAMELSDSLEDEGYDVVGTANNGRKALDLFKRQPVDLLLCDITIKGDWDGIQTVQHLVAERPVPVIYLTALTDRETLDRAKQTYPAAYVNKPYQLHSLRTAIELAIHNFTARATPTPANQPVITPSERDVLGREAILQINDYLFIKQNYQFVKVNLSDLLYLEADNIYTTLYTTGRKYVLRLTLSGILERINQPELVRIHRSYAVNIHKVDSFNEAEVSIGPQLIPLSRSYKDDFLRHFLHR
ncbi:response regulator [Spirosoma sp. KCTC 42546]|uniref:response regulator n=1 Tax=Spirosoma sp. KCTC 42546 TaxID=2520506 RepID=UPI0011579350|nr:response regulator [Spirosoma sp. KCTC 42546]QDK81517.1 response regulator [Spirosoma sp. KCTC 42546]